MLTLEQALQHGAAVGVKYYVKNSYDKIVGGTCTEEQALSMKKRFEEEDKHNPWIAMVGHSKQLSDHPARYDLSEQSARPCR